MATLNQFIYCFNEVEAKQLSNFFVANERTWEQSIINMYKQLTSIRYLRNKVAHGERILGFESNLGSLNENLKIIAPDLKLNDRRKIRDILIFMSIFLTKDEYIKMISEIQKYTIDMKQKVNNNVYNRVIFSDLGFKTHSELLSKNAIITLAHDLNIKDLAKI